MLKSVMAYPNRSPSSWNYWGFYLIELLQLTVGLGIIIFLTKIQSFIYNLSAICQRMNDKKIANCMQFAIKRNIMKKKEVKCRARVPFVTQESLFVNENLIL